MPTVPVSCDVVEAAVDWMTLTRRRDRDFRPLRHLAIPLLREQADIGNEITPWRGRGYRGEAAGSVRWGERELDEILQLSGERAAALWREALPWSTNVSRMDLQVTVQAPPEAGNLAVQGWTDIRLARAWDRERHANSKELGSSLYLDSTRGQTLTLGRRGSRRYARLYDKSLESRGERPPGQWRYEIELTQPIAAPTAAWLVREPSEPSAVVSAVWRHFMSRGVAPVFAQRLSEEEMPRQKRSQSDAERQLEWLAKMVRPTVLRLEPIYGREYLMAVLGLDDASALSPTSEARRERSQELPGVKVV